MFKRWISQVQLTNLVQPPSGWLLLGTLVILALSLWLIWGWLQMVGSSGNSDQISTVADGVPSSTRALLPTSTPQAQPNPEQPVLNPKQDLAALEQRAQQAIATAQAALAVSAPNSAMVANSDATRASTMDAPSSDSQSQVIHQLSDQPADNPPLAPQRQAKIDQLHSQLQQLQAQQARQQQLRQDKQDSLSRYGLE